MRPHAIPPLLSRLLLAVAFVIAGCGGGGGVPDAGDVLGLMRASRGAPGIELHAAQQCLPAARLAARVLREREGRPVRILPIGSEGERDTLRILIGGVDEPAISQLLDPLGFDVSDGGFGLLERRFEGPDDGLVLTAPDPDRPGLPVVVIAANRATALIGAQDLIRPQHRPGWELWRNGTPEVRGRFVGAWPCRARLDEDLGETWSDYRAARRPTSLGELQLRAIPSSVGNDRARPYLVRAAETKRRALEWAGVDPRTSSAPIFVHEAPRAMLARLGRVELGWRSPIGGGVHVLFADDELDDHGRALAEAAALRALGPPAQPWLLEGLSVWACDHWWRRPLEAWVARLHAGTLAASVAELVGTPDVPIASPHRYGPQRGFLFGWLIETRGADFVRALWDGTSEFVVDEQLELGFHEALEQTRLRYADRLGRSRTLSRRVAKELPFLRGTFLLPPRERDGLLSVTTDAALLDLRGVGANTIALSVLAHEHEGVVAADRSDLELILFSERARERKFVTVLVPNLLTSPSGDLAARGKHATEGELEELFARYEGFATHYALVAELARIPILALGSELGPSADSRRVRLQEEHRVGEAGDRARAALDPTERARATLEAAKYEAENFARTFRSSAWDAVIQRMRGVYDGQLTYVAGSPVERSRFDKWNALDIMSTEHFLQLEVPEEPGAGPTDASPPTREELSGRLVSQFERFLQDAELSERPGLVLGLGFPATTGGWYDPQSRSGEASPEAARLHGEALAEALQTVQERYDSLMGVVLWCWHADPARSAERPRGFDLRIGRDSGLIRRILGAE